MISQIKFNVPALVGREFQYLQEALDRGQLSGNGYFTKRCQALISERLGGGLALLAHSCTAALEMSAILSNVQAGDEVIMASYTFTSTANAVVLRGGVPVFVDIRADTLNIDETLIEAAITPRTKAIFVVHYAGVACEMDTIMQIAETHGLRVVEDAAQAMHASYRGQPLGSFGHFSALSFHATKNIIAGEGGALVVNDPEAAFRAEVIWEKGTNRAQFQRGEVSKYSWVDVGSSFLPSELTAAFLLAQLEEGPTITARRLDTWQGYHAAFAALEAGGNIRRPVVPQGCGHNAHIYYLLARDAAARDALIAGLAERNIAAVTHYVPLHSSPAGLRFGRAHGSMSVTCDVASRLLRLPLHSRMGAAEQSLVVQAVEDILSLE